MYQSENRCDDGYCGYSSFGCLRVILAAVAALSLFVIGIIIGAFISGIVMAALAAFIVLAVVLVLAAIGIGFYIFCRRRNC